MHSNRITRFISRSKSLFILSTVMALAACNDNDRPDISKIKIELQTKRLDRDLIAIDTTKVEDGVKTLMQKYPVFLPFYVNHLLPFVSDTTGLDKTTQLVQPIANLITDKQLRGLFDTVTAHFPNTKKQDEALQKGFQYMKYYYPEYHPPQIVYFISALNSWRAITFDEPVSNHHFLGVGLDMFLGENYPYYASVGIPFYMMKTLRPEYIASSAFRAIYEGIHPFEMEGRNLLDMVMQRGKEQYFLKKILPDENDTTLLGYTTAQLEWCKKNEVDVYNFFIQKNLLYETNWQKILRYVHEAPNATGMPPESPGNIGSWLGLQIVNAYMEKHPKVTLQQLLETNDAQKILQEGAYKPR